MTEFRSRILQSKQNESSLIANSRKRKLRELYAVADCDGPIPHSWVIVDSDPSTTPPTPSAAEALFLEHNDILQRRIFDETSLPPRRQLRSHTLKVVPFTRKGQDVFTPDGSRLAPKGPHNVGTRKSRGGTPNKEMVAGLTNASTSILDTSRRGRSAARTVDPTPKSPRRTSSRSSQTDKLPSTEVAPDNVVGDTVTAISQFTPATELDELGLGPLEKDRLRNIVESRSSSPGVDPRKAIPISAEDAAQLDEPLINGSQDEHHKALTAHLPPPEIQEDRLRQIDARVEEELVKEQKEAVSGSLSINLPPPHTGRALGEPLSSPGSTIDAQSATTPALHEASTDTSPDNEGPRYYADRSDENNPDPEIPPELAPSKEEVLQKQEHDKLLKAQIEVARSDILGNSPITADAQLRLEEEQAAAASSNEAEREIPDSEKSGGDSSQDVSVNGSQGFQPDLRGLTRSAGEIAQDIMDDEDDEVVGVPTPEDEKVPSTEPVKQCPITTGEEDAMDVDSSPVEDSVESDVSQPAVVQPTVETAQIPMNSEKSPIIHKDTSSIAESVPSPRPISSVHVPTPPTLERMTTRVSSGAMRHKSVSEILGEIPRPNTTPSSERNSVAKSSIEIVERMAESSSHSRATTPQSPASRMRTMVERAKEKERSKLSTVVFAKQASDRPSRKALIPSSARAQDQESGDYFMPLIMSQVYNSTRGVQPLETLLLSARKTLSTSNAYVPFHEHQSHKILRRIHTLQTQDKWSFRQPKRSLEPNRPTSHWDEVIKEAKWMRTDFREERKWKMAVAKNLARACAEWVEADEEDRVLLQVKTSIPARDASQMQKHDLSSAMDVNHSNPELEASAENDSQVDDFDEEPRASLLDAVAPTAMFSLGDDDVVFGLRRSPATDKLLEELPMYGCPLKVPQSDLPTSEVDPDSSWRKPALPLSRYMEGKIVLKDSGPPRKKSRYEYELEDEDEDDDQVVFGSQAPRQVNLEPALLDVALFNPENKHIRDRIHAGHQFRPPSENPMPLQSFFECRSSSQWTWAEDDELKTLVREYSYNWQLISSILSTRSLFASSAERRTPWECFERWIHLEGLPADMQKTHYFRAYNNRLEAAQRNLMAQAAQQPPQANAAGAAITPVRRRTTTSVRVEKRRNQKHLTLVDAMRKLAKKRETSLQKQQHAAGLAASRKANEASQPQAPRHTPQDFSRFKHEREMQLLERVQRHQMQQEAQRRQAMQQGRTGQQNPQQYPNGVPQPPRNLANPNATAPVSLPNANRQNQLAVPGQNLPHAQMQPLPNGMAAQLPMPNGHAPIPQMPLKGVPQAQMQGMPGMSGMPGLPTQHRMPAPNPAPDLRLAMQVRQISEQQRQAVQLQQQGQNPQIHNSPPNMRANMNMSQQAFMQNNQAMMATFNTGNMNGVSTPPGNGLNVSSAGPAGSPRMTHPNQSQQPNGSIPPIAKLESQVRAQFPAASPEQISKLVRDALSQSLASQRQSAMHAAAGSGTALSGMPGGIQNSPQQYAQMLRAQQERQAANSQPRATSAGSGSGVGMGK